MIKMIKIAFDKLDVDNHWANFLAFGNWYPAEPSFYDSFRDVEEKLEEGKCYQLGFDQSTSCTGIFVKDYENTVVYMIEVSKKRGMDASDYIFELELFLHSFAEKAVISHLIYERPIISESYRSSQVLFQLEGMIQTLPKRYAEFKPAVLDNIENSSWRRVVIKDEYDNRSINRKLATEKSVKDILPWARMYGESIGSDRDIFEAVGVFFGWFLNSYDTFGRPYVRGDKYSGTIGGFILPNQTSKEVSESLKENGIEGHWFMQNPRKSIYENIACAVHKYQVVCVEFNDLQSMLALTMECNIKWVNPTSMVAILVAANYVNPKLFEITGKEYHFVI